ncbi:MAG: dTMP kinase, partial [Patescibacteria group bacterium]
MRGIYIALEGIVGSGKTTQLPLIFEFLKQSYPEREIVLTREPGGTKEAEKIREKVKHTNVSPIEEVQLFAQARESTISEIVRPALKRGAIVLSDRSISSSLSHQTGGRGVDTEYVWWRNEKAVGDTFPDYILYLDVNFETCIKRSAKENPDKFDTEGVEFWQRVKAGYEEGFIFMIDKLGVETQILRVEDKDGNLSVGETLEQIKEKLKSAIDSRITEGQIVGERQR